MQTILGASGQIGTELARSLHDEHTRDIRLVSRRPRALHETDEVRAADLLDPVATSRAVAGSETVYLTVGLPPDAGLWARQLPVMMRSVIDACAEHGARLVFFDNTYMYPQTAAPLTEDTAFAPVGPKAVTRARIAEMLLEAMAQERVEAVICRAPEFYGPGRTQSFTNALVFDRIRAGRPARVPVSATTRRSLIWTPDASRATALIGNTPEAFGRTWHLPIDRSRPAYRDLLALAERAWGRPIASRVMPAWQFRLAGLVSRPVREIGELLPRYAVDSDFVTDDFERAFPGFRVTSFREGVEEIAAEDAEPTAGG